MARKWTILVCPRCHRQPYGLFNSEGVPCPYCDAEEGVEVEPVPVTVIDLEELRPVLELLEIAPVNDAVLSEARDTLAHLLDGEEGPG